ncbi:MAG: Ig-like domain-containing protein, partial [Muribaculaceae bacterium]|nr:Ig-like domain-containing protein [Muribaculaceae bacterium]
EWPGTFGTRYIRSIEVVYTRALGDKQECGLTFSEMSAEAVIGAENTYPELSNPNNLPLTWSSSDESVATVNAEGKVTLIGGGKTMITVETEGNDSFAAGNARYELYVIPVADNLLQMKELAPDLNDRVMVKFPLTVVFANGSYTYVVDADGNAACIEYTGNSGGTSQTSVTKYKIGQVLPSDWIAENATIFESWIWKGVPPAVVETVEVTYPEVDGFTPADADRVVTLMNVTFTTRSASGNTKAYGTTPDGTMYEFQDTYDVKPVPAGTYDVTGIVRYTKKNDKVYFYMAPISYAESKLPDSGVEIIDGDDLAPRYYNLQGVEVASPGSGIFVRVSNGKASKVVIK